jgi:hypothetical protein
LLTIKEKSFTWLHLNLQKGSITDHSGCGGHLLKSVALTSLHYIPENNLFVNINRALSDKKPCLLQIIELGLSKQQKATDVLT